MAVGRGDRVEQLGRQVNTGKALQSVKEEITN